jgi:hypothetical protein
MISKPRLMKRLRPRATCHLDRNVEALKAAGMLRNAADVYGVIFAKREGL